MIIDFAKTKETVMEKFHGGEKAMRAKMYADGLNKILYATLIPGASVGMHMHDESSESVYIVSGKGKMLYDDKEEELYPGVCGYCPKGHSHSIINDGTEDLVFFAVVPVQ